VLQEAKNLLPVFTEETVEIGEVAKEDLLDAVGMVSDFLPRNLSLNEGRRDRRGGMSVNEDSVRVRSSVVG
jgi:hypothetical protein